MAQITDAQRIEMNRLLRRLFREENQAECDKIEARIRELEAGNGQAG
jgi:hypothetical protein